MNRNVDTSSIEWRAEEIKILVSQDDLEYTLKKLLDFCRDFSTGNNFVNTSISLKAEWARIRMERIQLGRYDVTEAKYSDLIARILDLVDLVVEYYVQSHGGKDRKHVDRTDLAIIMEDRVRDPVEAVSLPIDRITLGQDLRDIESRIVLEAADITKSFRSSSFILSDISLVLTLGSITSLVGPNASGKTTLLKVLLGEISADNGSLDYPLFQTDNKGWYCIKQQTASISDTIAPWKAQLKDTLHYMASIKGLRGEENRTAVEFIIHRLGLESYQNLRWNQLSSGYKMRFELAKSLVWRPKLLVLDEPLANLDVNAQQVFLQDLRDMASSSKYPMAIIVASQHLHEVEAISDNIIFLENGRIKFAGTMEDLGTNSSGNSFEIAFSSPTPNLADALGEIQPFKIDRKSAYYVIHTPREVTTSDILQALLRSHVEITFFRDISSSSKRLFADLEDTEVS